MIRPSETSKLELGTGRQFPSLDFKQRNSLTRHVLHEAQLNASNKIHASRARVELGGKSTNPRETISAAEFKDRTEELSIWNSQPQLLISHSILPRKAESS